MQRCQEQGLDRHKVDHVIDTQGLFANDLELAKNIMKHPQWINPIRMVQIPAYAGVGDPQELDTGGMQNMMEQALMTKFVQEIEYKYEDHGSS